MCILGAGRDYFAHVLTPILAPVPHEKRVRTVIGVAAAIHLDIAGVIGKLPLILVAQDVRIARLREQAIKKLDVTRMEVMVKLVGARVVQD